MGSIGVRRYTKINNEGGYSVSIASAISLDSIDGWASSRNSVDLVKARSSVAVGRSRVKGFTIFVTIGNNETGMIVSTGIVSAHSRRRVLIDRDMRPPD